MPLGSSVREESSSVRVLLKVTVEVSEDRSETIIVCEGDDPHELSKRFCKCHGLDTLQFVEPLELHIRENLSRAVRGPQGLHREQVQKVASQRPRSEPHLAASTDRPSTGGASSSALPQSARGSSRPSGRLDDRPLSARGASAEMPRVGSAKTVTTSSKLARSSTGIMSTRAVSSTDKLAFSAQAPPAGRKSTSSSSGALNQGRQRRSNVGHSSAIGQKLQGAVGSEGCEQPSRVSYGSESASTPRRPRGSHPGERLYRDAAVRQAKLEALRMQEAERRREEEVKGVTFAPEIATSQRSCQGVPKSLMDPEGRNTKLKIELQRQQQASEALKGCTFKPEIDQHSEEIVNSRISRLKVTGALHDQLYEDAQRRRERLAHYSTMVPLGVTFQPDIGANHYRPPNDDTQEDFVNRLAYSKSYSEQWLSMRQQQEEDAERERQQRDSRVLCEPSLASQMRKLDAERQKARIDQSHYFYELARSKGLDVQPLSARSQRLSGGQCE